MEGRRRLAVERDGSMIVGSVVLVMVLAILVSAFFTISRQQTGTERLLFRGARANEIAASGLHVAMAVLRRNSSFRGTLTGAVDEGGYEVVISNGSLADDPATPWVREDRYLKAVATGSLGSTTRRIEAILSLRSPFTEFLALNARRDVIPWTAPTGHPDMRATTKPWNAAAMVAWATPDAPNPDYPGSINRYAGFGWKKDQPPMWGSVLIKGGPLYMREWLPLEDMVIPHGLHCASYVIVQPDHVGSPGIDVDGDGAVDAGQVIYSSDAITQVLPSDGYREEDSLGKKYPGGNPRILDRDSPHGGGFLEIPGIDFDYYRELAKAKGIYIAPDGKVQLGFKGEGAPSDSHGALYPTTAVTLYSDSLTFPPQGSWPGGRWAQARVAGTFVHLGTNDETAAADPNRNPFHADNLPDEAVLFSDCPLQIEGIFGKDCTIVTTANTLIVGDVNAPKFSGFPTVADYDAYAADMARPSVALLFPMEHGETRNPPGWSLDASPPAWGAIDQIWGWNNFSVHLREGHWNDGGGKNAPDAGHHLDRGVPDDFDVCAVVHRAGGAFFDGYKLDDTRPHPDDATQLVPARQLFGAETTWIHGRTAPPVDVAKRYGINVFGSYTTNWGPYSEGAQDISLLGGLRLIYDPRLPDRPPPHLPASVNVVRWRRL